MLSTSLYFCEFFFTMKPLNLSFFWCNSSMLFYKCKSCWIMCMLKVSYNNWRISGKLLATWEQKHGVWCIKKCKHLASILVDLQCQVIDERRGWGLDQGHEHHMVLNFLNNKWVKHFCVTKKIVLQLKKKLIPLMEKKYEI